MSALAQLAVTATASADMLLLAFRMSPDPRAWRRGLGPSFREWFIFFNALAAPAIAMALARSMRKCP